MTRIPRHAQPDGFDALPDAPVYVESPWGPMKVDENKPFVRQMEEIGRRPYAEQVPTVNRSAQALMPYLKMWANAGYPNLSERDRNDANNAVADLEIALSRMVR